MVSLGKFAVLFLELYYLGHKNTRLVYTLAWGKGYLQVPEGKQY